ncbi:Transcriptional activator protein acu-15 [Colletotrichum aenigma]|uniref:Transcriptional activator protein acu-15 n=1 Tax=Colletotrichum aenigma TaxID=1215731 RepID=UPI0018727D22|nr:Transcriptional activator protein acu-15 [Colletotrichum aenigma]KAF5520219.1 Transcriptional activator protein acu-15 [Colletotrichum aenigma]
MSQTLYGIPWLRAQREIACCRCRRRKKKCDKRRPLCGECARSGAECVPLAPKKSAMTTLPAGYIHLLEEHIATLETRLRQSNPSIAGDHFLSDPRARPVNTPASMDLIADDAVPPLNLLSRLSDGSLDVAGPASPTDTPGAGPVATPDWVLGTFDEAIDFDLAALSGRDISPLTNPPRDRMTDQSQLEPTTFEADDIQDTEPGAPSLQLAIQEERLTESYLPLSVAVRCVKEYFTSAHPMWPFLHRQQWEDWWKYWSGTARQMNSPGSQTFFVDMVLSIGALLVHGSTPLPNTWTFLGHPFNEPWRSTGLMRSKSHRLFCLLHQFQAGVGVVFCLWATPTHQQMALYDRRPVCQALFACLATLIDFASKWSSAQVFRDVFELLMEAVPVVEFGDPSQSWSITPPQSANLQLLVTELEDLKVQQKVINMLKTMRKGRVPFTSPSVEETQWIQYEHNEHMS